MNNQLKAQIFEAHHVLDKKTAEIALDFNVSEDIVDLVIEVGNMGIEYDTQLSNAVNEIRLLKVEAKLDKDHLKHLRKEKDDLSTEFCDCLRELALLRNCVIDAQKEKVLLAEKTKTAKNSDF